MFELMELIDLCKEFGIREDLVQAGGGNISVKNLDLHQMYIKASGCSLFDVDQGKNYKVVFDEQIKNIVKNNESLEYRNEKDLLDSMAIDTFDGHPSIETFIHALTGKYTVHLHPMAFLSLSNKELNDLFPQALMVEYIKPGFKLARKIYELSDNKELPEIILLENHGIVFHANDLNRLNYIIADTMSKCEHKASLDFCKYRQAVSILKSLYYVTRKYFYVAPLMFGVSQTNFSPDYVVYRGKILDLHDNVETFIKDNGFPSVVKLEDSWFVVGKDFETCKKLESIFNMYSAVMYSKRFKTDGLTDEEANELLDWDSEKYRKNGDN